MVYAQALFDGLRPVVLADDQGAAAFFAEVAFGGRFVVDVVACAALFTNPAAGKPFFNHFISHVDVDGLVDDDPHLVQGLSLRNRPGEAIQDEAVFAVILRQALFDDPDDHIVGYQLAGVHKGLGLKAHFSTVFQRLADDVAGADGGDVQSFT